MKTLFTLVAVFAAVSSFASPDPRLEDVPSPDQIAQSIEFTGKPGVHATATLVKTEGDDFGSIMITHQREYDVAYYVGAMSDSLFGTNPALPGFTTLSKNAAGSLLISSENDSTGRDRWSRTLTVAYRNGSYKIIGFTYRSIDTITMKTEECDYNLMTKRGYNKGRAVKISTEAIEFNKFMDSEKEFTCKGW